ncbi:hypothetical protein F7725_001468 [Dissostichus mawsoni]|uniref:Uncharacterized protein n=1 Tax=Dissostichus mawsoni TaxID=36200 RepID=A0A7J5ZHW1_DISMA|nr:hypothetical protein F7725_001468 [Dissostichus mawsoni]
MFRKLRVTDPRAEEEEEEEEGRRRSYIRGFRAAASHLQHIFLFIISSCILSCFRQTGRQTGSMSAPPPLADLSRLYQTEFVRSVRAVGALWAVCALCSAVLQLVVLLQPAWVHSGGGGEASGTLGLFQVCVDSDWLSDCRGSVSSLSPLPSFQSVAVLVGVSLWAVWTSVLSLILFRFCSAATVYKICGWLQLTSGFCMALACLLFPDSWESNCSVHWAYILALLGILDSAILATLAFVLANRQDALLPPDSKDVTTGLLMRDEHLKDQKKKSSHHRLVSWRKG